MRQSPTNLSRLGACALLAAAAFGLTAAPPASAQDSTAPAAPASHNVYSAGGQVRPAGPVEGDFIAAGGRVVLDQPVRGDAALAGGSVDVRAPVGDDLRAVGGDVRIDSTVGGELFVTGGNVTLAGAARVTQGAKVYGGAITMDGRVDGPLEAGAQKISLNGQIGGDARLTAEQIELGPDARIAGALHYASGTELKKAAGATVVGAITREERAAGEPTVVRQRQWGGATGTLGAAVLGFLALLACATVFMLVVPDSSVRAADTVKTSPGLSLALGFGALVALPVLAVLLFITVLGIPLGLTLLALYPVLLLAGYLVGVLCIARLAQPALRKEAPATFGWQIGFFALALLLVSLIGRVPVAGTLVLAVITVMGTGASVLMLYRRRQNGPGSALSPSQAAPMTALTGSARAPGT
ncbi:hypothetical protein ACFPOE_15290 [Caenimonas terrae]|uniref:DUF8173 domain-containing protein n=1 Tax=Caenimonas terrae TaxID=696074 RepID=A0ABW0NG08_9BURK